MQQLGILEPVELHLPMMKPRWHWTAKYRDGTVKKQPKGDAPFLGDLDKSQVAFFIVRRFLKSFSLDVENGEFKEGKKTIAFTNAKPEQFYCVRRITVDNLGHVSNRKIIFGYEQGIKLVIDESGSWFWE